LVFVLLASPVLAAGSGRDTYQAVMQGPTRLAHVISMTGTITRLGTQSFYVYVQMTNKPYIVSRGTTVLVGTNARTLFYVWNGKTHQRVTFAALAVGQRISINAQVTTTAITASRVEVSKPRYP